MMDEKTRAEKIAAEAARIRRAIEYGRLLGNRIEMASDDDDERLVAAYYLGRHEELNARLVALGDVFEESAT